MHTLHPEALIFKSILYEFRNKNVKLCHCGRHRRVVQIIDLFFEDFLSYELPFALFQTIQIRILKHF